MFQSESQISQIACRNCRHYYVTWDARFPYGCRAHGFKSGRNPAQDVLLASGLECLLFTPKPSSAGCKGRTSP
jgi:hypothetical protein